ncbi:MAG: hypothetical protein V4812_22750 [Pseudomonadota bacterium]
MKAARLIYLFQCLLLILAILAWLIVVGGNLYAEQFVSDAVHAKSIMSPRGIYQLMAIIVAWWITAAVFAIALGLLAFAPRSRALVGAALVSGAYFIPSVAILVAVSFR